ncbi:MAG: AAA family ATPase, partial [Gammaproteobacteria bacterium]|nr:AAA family ATPase [Gammaproteobacteria bacterium]NIR99144.1 AAA family ATPase [Gammaproteobacteria bacterium]NIT64784.1 AAA family ATPase [Gammaproteobacteria bacterium]NIV21753.1 AAA family ATPase [Gammaproteobacteria bacterium]NIX10671.1 AAA family ATPase [Gammaproteobacteria bacterium]
CDNTELSFDADGITMVVGPNGCGKSNVVDAVRWALGEQSPRLMRSSAMADVIFAGSTSRKPVGRAEVTLLFDNSAHTAVD